MKMYIFHNAELPRLFQGRAIHDVLTHWPLGDLTTVSKLVN